MTSLENANAGSNRGSALAALLLAGDFRALAAKAQALLTGRRPLLPADLTPAHRPAGTPAPRPARARPLILMAGPNLLLEGAPLSQLELATGLAAKGWDVRVCAPADGPLSTRYRAAGLSVEANPRLSVSPSVPSWYERGVATLAAWLQDLAPDLVYANTVDMFPVIDAARLAGLPSIWNVRESEDWRARLADRHPRVAARAVAAFSYPEAVVFVAGASRRAWERFVRPDAARVIRNAPRQRSPLSDDERRRLRAEMGAGPDEKLIVSIGTICERKGQADIAAAFSDLPARFLDRSRLAFIGRSEAAYRIKVERALSDGARARTRFVGSVDDAVERLAAADALVHAARSEAFPRVFLEAAAVHTPIVAAPVDGAGERLEDGRSALFYPAGDIASLASQLTRVLEDRDLAARLTKMAHQDLVAAWTPSDMVAAYDLCFRSAVEAQESARLAKA